MRTDKQEAIKLRKAGNSYTQIKEKLDISKSTLSYWLKDIELSKEAQEKIEKRRQEQSFKGLLERNKNQAKLAHQRKIKYRNEARAQIKKISKKELFFIGVALYWAEGYKRPIVKDGREVSYHPVSFTNSDPKMIKIFLQFIREICNVKEGKIKAGLRIFSHMNEKEIISFWQKQTRIPKKNFTKTYIAKSRSENSKRPFNRLPFGVIQIRINDTQLFHTIMGWIEGVKELSE